MFWVDDRKLGESRLLHQEISEFGPIRFFAIDSETWLACRHIAWVITEAGEIATFNGLSFFLDGIDKAAFDMLFQAWAIADDKGWTIVRFCFFEGLDGFHWVCAESDLSDIDVSIRHRDQSKVLLGFFLTGSGEFVDGTGL